MVVGAGPAGVVAALRAARLGASTALVTRDQFGGMAANDGPVPVRTLAQAARLIREARQLPLYGIAGGEPSLDYARLLTRVRDVTADARQHTLLRDDLERAGVSIYEQAGTARFADAHTVESGNAPQLRADKVILCTGGASRPLAVPGFDLTATHSDAWRLSSVPPSLVVIGAGATGVQVASIFNAFGSQVYLVEIAPRILMSEDQEVSEAVVADAGTVDRFERCATGVRLIHSASDGQHSIDATLAVVAAGWVAATAGLGLDRAGVQTDRRGYVQVDAQLRTTVPHVFAAGDVTGRALVVHEAIRQGLVAATNAVLGAPTVLSAQVSPIGSFTDPEYASAGLTEAAARENREVVAATVRFDSLPRPIIDGRQTGFCKLVVDRELHTILGCHVVGERAVELAQLAATAMTAKMPVEELAFGPVLVSHLRERPGPRGDPRRDRTRSHRNVGRRSSRNGSGGRRCLRSLRAHAVETTPLPKRRKILATPSAGTPRPGVQVGSASEFSLFFRVRPGHENDLRDAVEALQDSPGYRPGDYQMPIASIHEARFVLFDGDTRLLFATSFDGPWDAYMEDFASKALQLFDAIFRHVEGYEGLPDLTAVKDFILSAQVTAGAYARNYPGTVKEIRKALRVNEAFQQVLDDPGAADALRHPALKPLLNEAADA